MSCLSNKEVKDALTGLISNHLYTRSKAGTKIELEPYIREIYDFIKQSSGDELTAITGARMVPTLINLITTYKPQLAAELKKSSPALRRDAFELSELFEESVDNVVSRLGLTPPTAESLEATEKGLEEAKEQTIVDTKVLFDNGLPLTDAGLGEIRSVGSEVKQYKDPTAPDFLQPTPKQQRNFAVMRILNENLTKQIQSKGISSSVEMEYPGVDGGVYVRIMNANHVHDTYVESQATLTHDPGSSKGELVAILTDKTGRALRFDEAGTVTPEGKIAYYLLKSDPTRLQRPITAKDIEKEINDELRARRTKGANLSAEQYNNLRNEIAKELLARHELFRKLRQDLIAHPNEARYAAITGMSNGIVNYNTYKLTPLSKINWQGQFNPVPVTKEQTAESGLEQGQSYFDYPGVTEHIYVIAPRLADRPDLVRTLLSLYTDPLSIEEFGNLRPITNQERKDLIEQYITDKKVNIQFYINKDGSYKLRVNGIEYLIKATEGLSEATAIELRNAITRELTRGNLAPEFANKNLTEKNVQVARNLGAKVIYDVTKVQESGPGTIYAEPIGTTGRFKYYNTIFQSLNVSAPLLNAPDTFRNVSIEERGGQKIAVLKNMSYKDFLKDNFFTTAVPSSDGIIRQINPYLHFVLSADAAAKYMSEKPKNTEALKTVNEAYKGKIIFATPGTGKTTVAQSYANVIDADSLILKEMARLHPDITIQDSEHPFATITDFFKKKKNANELYEIILGNVGAQALNLAKEGYTVLTGSGGLIRIADYVYHQTNPELIRNTYKRAAVEPYLAEEVNKSIVNINQYMSDVLAKTPAENETHAATLVEKPKVEAPPVTNAPATTETTADSNDDDLINSILKNDKFLEKSRVQKYFEQRATPEQITAAREWYANSPISKHFPFDIVFAALNTNTPGPAAQWAIHGVTLFQYYDQDGKHDIGSSGDFTDLYHEAWHGFTQTFLTKAEREKLYNEVRNKQGSFRDYNGNLVQFSTAKAWQLEEYLAEDFRKFMLTGGKENDSTSSVKMNIFQRILKFLKELFTGVNVEDAFNNPMGIPMVQEMYNNLRVGNLSSYNFNVQNRDQTIGVLNKTLESIKEDDETPQLGFDDSNLLVRTTDSLISEFVNKLINASKVQDQTGRGIHSYTSQLMQDSAEVVKAYKYVKRQFEGNIMNKLTAERDAAETEYDKLQVENKIKLVEWAIKNFGDLANNRNGRGLIAYHLAKSEYLSLEDKDLAFGDIDETNIYVKAMEAYDRSGNESSQEELATADVNYLMRSIHKYEDDGKPSLNKLGVQELTEYYIVWNKIARIFGGPISRQEMYNKMQEAAAKDPVIREVIEKLGPPQTLTTAETELWINFWQTFNMTQIKLIQMSVKKDEANKYYVTIGTTHTHSDKAGQTWRTAFRMVETPFLIKDRNEGDHYGSNYLHMTKVLDKYYDSVTNKFRGSKFDFFRDIGIRLTDKPEIRQAVNEQNVGNAPAIMRRIYNMVHKRGIDHVYQLEDLFDEIEPSAKGKEDGLPSEASNFEALQELETKYSDIMSNYMVTNAAGNTQYEQSLNNTMTVYVQAINDAPSYRDLIAVPWLKHLDLSINPLVPYIMLDSLFDMNDYKNGGPGLKRTTGVDNNTPIKLNLSNLSGAQLITGDGNEGIESAKADEFTKLIMDFHLMTEAGKPELMRHADKGTSFSLWLTKINGGSKDGKHYIDSSKFVVSELGTIPGFNDATHKLLPYVDGELRRIKAMRSLAQNQELSYDLNYLTQGQNFVIFEDVLPKSLQDKLLNYNSLYSIDPNGVQHFVNNDLINEINKAINKYFELQSADVKKLMTFRSQKGRGDNLLFMSDQLINSVFNRQGVKSKAEAKDALIRSFVVNSWIHNIETMGLLYGDVAQYKHKKEEFHKRNAGAGSTGTLFATDPDILNYVNKKGRLYARSLGVAEKQLAMDGSYDSAILADNEIPSSYIKSLAEGLIKSEMAKNSKTTLEEARKRILGFEKNKIGTEEEPFKNGVLYPYVNMNEGDAQGWITFDFYRATSILNGKWSRVQEKLYRDICEGKEVPLESITEFFPVRKFQYWGNMRVPEGTLPLNAFHKFSLMPLIPNVIKGTNLEALHHKMINQDIDYALFESGSKVSTITKIVDGKSIKDKFYSDSRTHTFQEAGEFTKNTVYLQLLKNQLEIAPYYKDTVTFPTQMRKLIENGMMEGGVPTDFGTDLNLADRINKWSQLTEKEKLEVSPRYRRIIKYESDIAKLTRLRQKELENEAGIERNKDGELIIELDHAGNAKLTPKLEKFLINQMTSQDLAEHEINFVKRGPNNTLAHDLSLSLSVDKLERVLNSIVVRRLIRQKFKGESLVQVSGAGFETTLRGDLTDSERAKYGTNGLPFYQITDGKTKAMKVKIALQGDFKNLLYLKHNDGNEIGTLDRLNEMVKNDQWLSTDQNRNMVTIIGPRIPVQGLNSMEFAEVYEFLTVEAGNIVVLPAEIVAKSGGDFDIDKLTFMYPTIQLKFKKKFWDSPEGEIKLKEIQEQYKSILELDFSKENVDKIFATQNKKELSEADTAVYNKIMDKDVRGREVIYPTDTFTEDGLENNILNNMREILEAPENFGDLIRPNDTGIVKPIADELAQDVMDFNPKTRYNTENLTKEQTERIAGTRVFEIRYNLYKHMSNNIGKQTLGLGAVDNTYNAIFNRIGMKLNYSYIIPKTQINQPLRLLLQHNSLKDDEGRDVISLSHLLDAKGENSISDVISQLMNGWVDIAKDAWIFNLQGNKEMAPSLLFLIQAGVPVREAVLFISHPLIREYVKQQKLIKSTFADPLGMAPESFTLAQYMAKINVLLSMGIPADKIVKVKKARSQAYLNSVLQGALNDNPTLFDKDKIESNLLKRIKTAAADQANGTQFNVTSADRAIFLHFLEIEEMAKAVRDVKLNTNVDTSRANTLFEAENKMLSLEALKTNPIVPQEMVRRIEENSPISSFFIHEFQSQVWRNLFNIRNNDTVNRYLRNLIKRPDFKEQMVERTFGETEEYIKNWRNDLVSFIFQNSIRRFDLSSVLKSGNYDSIALSKATEVEKTPKLSRGIFGTRVDGEIKIYVDEQQLRNSYRRMSRRVMADYVDAADGTRVQLAGIDGRAFPNEESYFKFMFERELLRTRYEGKTGWEILQQRADVQDKLEQYTAVMTDLSKAQIETLVYEETIRDMALDNSYNNWKMFSSLDSVADNYIKILTKYPGLEKKYSILQNLSVSILKNAGVVGRVANIRLLDTMYNAEKLNVWNENLRQLSDPAQIELSTSNSVERERVAKFFNDLSIYAFMQSGMNTAGQFALTRLVPQEKITQMMTGPRASFLKNVNTITLGKYTSKFNTTNSNERRRTRGRFKDYTISDYNLLRDKNAAGETETLTKEQSSIRERLFTDAVGNVLFYANASETLTGEVKSITEKEAKAMLEEYPGILFVPNGVTGTPFGTTNEEALFKGVDLYPNIIGIPVKKKFSTVSKELYTDQVPGEVPNEELKNAIDLAIQRIIDYRNEAISRGEKVHLGFPGTGIGQYMIGANDRTGKLPEKGEPKPVALATFVYLSEQLYKHFGYVNPNMDKALSMMNKPNIVELNSEVTDDMVRDALTFCFNN